MQGENYFLCRSEILLVASHHPKKGSFPHESAGELVMVTYQPHLCFLFHFIICWVACSLRRSKTFMGKKSIQKLLLMDRSLRIHGINWKFNNGYVGDCWAISRSIVDQLLIFSSPSWFQTELLFGRIGMSMKDGIVWHFTSLQGRLCWRSRWVVFFLVFEWKSMQAQKRRMGRKT